MTIRGNGRSSRELLPVLESTIRETTGQTRQPFGTRRPIGEQA
ncbi:hypothetical protein [Paenibacillus pabuli]|nr:hypothetical protein [Paenibacillus pabuli]MEC0123472.1 hypothetical protein [Paenibacillus pabuli]